MEHSRSSLRVMTESPPNAESPLSAFTDELTPVPSFFVRSHFPIPEIDVPQWRLAVTGEVGSPREFDYEELRRMHTRTVVVTLECAGNGRTGFRVPADGELRWGCGAVGTAKWTGVPLRDVLERCRFRAKSSEVVVDGSDTGTVKGSAETIGFSRSLPLAKALERDTIIALKMNGRILSPEHGYPARLVVPRWYGMASVKWLSRVRVISGAPYEAHFNGVKYVYVRGKAGRERREPVREMRVKSLVTSPADGVVVQRGEPLTIEGRAWSGNGRVSSVEVDHGDGWRKATIKRPRSGAAAWVGWRMVWTPERRGEVAISARATDDRGNCQPMEPIENKFQYGYNAVQTARVTVV